MGDSAHMQPWMGRALMSVRNEWRDAPWFVVLIVAVVAFVGPGLIYGAWGSLNSLL